MPDDLTRVDTLFPPPAKAIGRCDADPVETAVLRGPPSWVVETHGESTGGPTCVDANAVVGREHGHDGQGGIGRVAELDMGVRAHEDNRLRAVVHW